MVESSEWTAIGHVIDRLAKSYPAVPADRVTEVVHHTHANYDGRPIRDFVPLFVERQARARLSSLT